MDIMKKVIIKAGVLLIAVLAVMAVAVILNVENCQFIPAGPETNILQPAGQFLGGFLRCKNG